uniref:Uncharacterized protein n=1 Tax=Cannabis sativa TaxID=3483 RepID=A0A803QMJ5_CANSA
MGRKRKATTSEGVEDKSSSEETMAWDEMVKEAAALGGGAARRARKRFVGVRQRPSGRWVAEIKDTIQKIRVCALDFQFMNDKACNYSPFEIAEVIEEPMDQEAAETFSDEPSMLREAMKRMKYERKFSASLYAFNGIPECLKLKIGAMSDSDQLRSLKNACNKNKEEIIMSKDEEEHVQVMMEKKEDHDHEELESSNIIIDSDFSDDGELMSLWTSLDLPPICFVN